MDSTQKNNMQTEHLENDNLVLNERFILEQEKCNGNKKAADLGTLNTNTTEEDEMPSFALEWDSFRGVSQCSCGKPIHALSRKVSQNHACDGVLSSIDDDMVSLSLLSPNNFCLANYTSELLTALLKYLLSMRSVHLPPSGLGAKEVGDIFEGSSDPMHTMVLNDISSVYTFKDNFK